MKRGLALIAFLGACLSLEAAPSVWTPADDALPTTTAHFSETPLGRFETIAVGSFPITLFYVGFGFDVAIWAQNGFQSLYAPWPFKNASAPSPSQLNLETRLGAALALSAGIALLDLILKPLAEAKKAETRPDSHFPLPPTGVGDGENAMGPSSGAPRMLAR
ncbi:MAG TPA: hypothetical protein VMV44_05350 [Rectinemataceae bacterium]|nr:hypothetical protein [Rectinemataceae bacterium]